MERVIKTKGDKGHIALVEHRQEVAYLDFEIEDKRLVYATHTVVSPSHQGQGLAKQLVDLLVSWAEERSLLIQPICSYVVKLSERDERLWQRLETYSHAETIIQSMLNMSDPVRAQGQARFFKTGRGAYSEGDIFLGISLPQLRRMLRLDTATKGYHRLNLSIATLRALWQSPYHEVRMLGYLYLSEWAKRAKPNSLKGIYDLYISSTKYCNNWDLVDCSAPYILGAYWAERDARTRRSALLALAQSPSLWEQRIALVGTLGLIRRGLHQDTFSLVEFLIKSREDLIHKAMGWMLREVGKHIGHEVLKGFLDVYAAHLPLTTLRYALEHFDKADRLHYMSLRYAREPIHH